MKILHLTRRKALAGALTLPLAAGGLLLSRASGSAPRPLGFHLASWESGANADPALWRQAVEELAAVRVERVRLVAYRFIDPESGAVSPHSRHGAARGPTFEALAAGLEAAQRHGLDAALYPIAEIDRDSGPGNDWRGAFTLDEERLPVFFDSYAGFMESLVRLAGAHGARSYYLGSELAGLTATAASEPYWRGQIARLRRLLPPEGRLMYAANFDEYRQVRFWDALDDIGINAYFPLVEPGEATGAGTPGAALLVARWRRVLDALKSFSRHAGRPVVLSEWGAVPFEGTTAAPWEEAPSTIPDPVEQIEAYRAALEATRTCGGWLAGLDFWHWRLPGSPGSPFAIGPDSAVARLVGTRVG